MRFAVLALVLLTAVAGAAHVDVYPKDTTWTGGIFYIPSWPYWGYWWETPITWGNFLWMTTPCNERGFARYDLSPIPDGVTVTGATVNYFVYWDTLATRTEIRLFGIEPFPDSEPQAQEVYDSIAVGTLVGTRDSTVLGWNSVELDSAAHRAIEQALVLTDWLGLGWVYPGTDSADAVARGWVPDSLMTFLGVDYGPTGMAAQPGPLSQGFRVEQNPVLSGRLHVSVDCGPAVLTISDAAGRHRLTAPVRTGRSAVDLRGLAAGVYLVRLDAGSRPATRKFVVQR